MITSTADELGVCESDIKLGVAKGTVDGDRLLSPGVEVLGSGVTCDADVT